MISVGLGADAEEPSVGVGWWADAKGGPYWALPKM